MRFARCRNDDEREKLVKPNSSGSIPSSYEARPGAQYNLREEKRVVGSRRQIIGSLWDNVDHIKTQAGKLQVERGLEFDGARRREPSKQLDSLKRLVKTKFWLCSIWQIASLERGEILRVWRLYCDNVCLRILNGKTSVLRHLSAVYSGRGYRKSMESVEQVNGPTTERFVGLFSPSRIGARHSGTIQMSIQIRLGAKSARLSASSRAVARHCLGLRPRANFRNPSPRQMTKNFTDGPKRGLQRPFRGISAPIRFAFVFVCQKQRRESTF